MPKAVLLLFLCFSTKFTASLSLSSSFHSRFQTNGGIAWALAEKIVHNHMYNPLISTAQVVDDINDIDINLGKITPTKKSTDLVEPTYAIFCMNVYGQHFFCVECDQIVSCSWGTEIAEEKEQTGLSLLFWLEEIGANITVNITKSEDRKIFCDFMDDC
mgnify:CR=1 FL=1